MPPIDNNTILLIVAAAAGFFVWRMGWLTPAKKPAASKPGLPPAPAAAAPGATLEERELQMHDEMQKIIAYRKRVKAAKKMLDNAEIQFDGDEPPPQAVSVSPR